MKTTIHSTRKVGAVSHFYALFLLIFLLIASQSTAGEIVNVASIKVSKNYPASFVLDLESQDIVTVNYAQIGGAADVNQLVVQIIDLNQQDEEVINSFNRSGRDFLADYDGKYRIDFIYQGSGGLLRQKNLNLSISIDLDGFDGLEEGEAREILSTTNCVIEDTEAKALKLRYFLNKGDKVRISSNDSKAGLLKLKITQLAKMYSISGGTEITIPSDGTYSFNFFLDGDDNQSLLNLKEILSRDDFLFRDLSIYRERAFDFSAVNTASAGASETQNGDDGLFGGTDSSDPAAPFDPYGGIDVAQLLADGNKSTAEQSQIFMEAIAKQQEMMTEMMNRKNITTEIYSTPSDIELRLEPEFNFSSDNGNRKCEEILLPPSNFDIWFYWVGVGEEAEKALDEHNTEITRVFKKPLSEAAAEHIYGKFSGSAVVKRNPSFPDEAKYSKYLFEDAEYAIVDYNNRNKFLAGQRVSKLNQASRKSRYITSDNGISGRLGDDQTIYFCSCNNNKATPVNVFFRYYTIEYLEIEN